MTEQISSLQKIIDTVINFCVNYSFQVLGAVVILILGFVAARWASNFIFSICQKNKFDITLSRFISSVVRMFVLVFAGIIAMGNFGITITPFIAALGAVAFGATYALQGPLSNYCAGLTIILGRPFTVGDTITVAGQNGIVKEVKLPATILTDEDGNTITIPNKDIVGEVILNSKMYKAVDAVVGIGYDMNPENAIRVVTRCLNSVPLVSKNPLPQIGIKEFGDSSINIGYKYWVPTEKFLQVSYAVNLVIFKEFQKENINIPYPRRDVHVISETSKVSV